MSIGYILLITAAILFSIGIAIILARRNLIRIIIGMEIAATGVNINFIGLSLLKNPYLIDPLAHTIVIISILLDGALIGVALAMTLVVYRKFRTLDVDKIRKLRW